MKTRTLLGLMAVVVAGGLAVGTWEAPADETYAVPTAPQPANSVTDIIRLSQAKVSDDTIINYIKSSGNQYGLNPEQIIYLKNQGVSEPVIDAMLEQQTAGSDAGTSPMPAAQFVGTTDTGNAPDSTPLDPASASWPLAWGSGFAPYWTPSYGWGFGLGFEPPFPWLGGFGFQHGFHHGFDHRFNVGFNHGFNHGFAVRSPGFSGGFNGARAGVVFRSNPNMGVFTRSFGVNSVGAFRNSFGPFGTRSGGVFRTFPGSGNRVFIGGTFGNRGFNTFGNPGFRGGGFGGFRGGFNGGGFRGGGGGFHGGGGHR